MASKKDISFFPPNCFCIFVFEETNYYNSRNYIKRVDKCITPNVMFCLEAWATVEVPVGQHSVSSTKQQVTYKVLTFLIRCVSLPCLNRISLLNHNLFLDESNEQ